MRNKIYYTIPSNSKGNLPSATFTRKAEAIQDAKREYRELAKYGYSDGSLRVDVFVGNEEDYDASVDAIFTIEDEG